MSDSKTSERIVLVGAGLVGSLLAVLLRRRGFEVDVYERRPDMRRGSQAAGRSINLIATSRGRAALERVGLREKVRTAPVWGRTMHAVDGELTYQPYGKNDSEMNDSVSRGELNRILLSEAEVRGAKVHFEHRLVGGDPREQRLEFENGAGERVEVHADRVIGADGSASAVRERLAELGCVTSAYHDLGHAYKELEIPPAEGGGYRADERALHIWPRGKEMLMALPNHDGSFTVTLYLPNETDDDSWSFAKLTDKAAVQALFEELFPDAIALIPRLYDEIFENPTGRLGTVRCAPWNVEDRALLIGDSAHAIVPFFGQGMNCGFEDCLVFDDLVGEHSDGDPARPGATDWATVFARFSELRKPNGDAIADMSLENFVEMCASVGDPEFLLRKRVEHRLENELPGRYRTRYSMVTYSRIPYHLAYRAGKIQREILDELCAGIADESAVDLGVADRLIADRLEPFLQEHAISLDY